jgi:CTP synthase (UTP-ammonia lyase)
MQAMVITQAKRKGIKNPTSTEFTHNGTPVVDIIRGTKLTKLIGGTLRLGE